MNGEKKRLIFFVKQGLDSFLGDVIAALSGEFDTEKIIVAQPEQIDEAMERADICWFEWCDELAVYGSRLPAARRKRILCRLHSYEAFTDWPAQVNWSSVDRLLFVAAHIRDYVVEKFHIDPSKAVVIPNGLDLSKYAFREHGHGFEVAYAGYINYKKGPMLLLHTFRAMHERDSRYRLHIAGIFQDERDVLYFRQMIDRWGLWKNVLYEGWQDDLDGWLEDKDYILCTSVLESQNMSVMQAMAKGIKPIVHDFVGADGIYPPQCRFSTIPEAVERLDGEYDPAAYRRFVGDYCAMGKVAALLAGEIRELAARRKEEPLVSVVMTVYNRERFLREAIESVLEQSYRNVELIVVDDGSTDGSEAVARSFSDERLRYSRRENGGQLAALRDGLLRARGKYVTRVDSDDRADREYVEACVDAMEADDALRFVYADFSRIDEDGDPVGEIRFRDYPDPKQALLDVFVGFSSVIPDTSFWRGDYVDEVVRNYAEQNVPFYIDNLLVSKYRHIARPLYHYRQHGGNFAATPANRRVVLAGKIKFVDLLLRQYFLQADTFGIYRRDRQAALRLFSRYFAELGRTHGAQEDLEELFRRQAEAWAGRADKLAGQGGGGRPEEAAEPGVALNARILLVSADDPQGGRAVGGKHTHIHLLQESLRRSGVPCALVCCQPAEMSVDPRRLVAEWGIAPAMLEGPDHSFLLLVYAMQKQLEAAVEAELRGHFFSCISCQDVIAAAAARRVLRRLGREIPVVVTLHGYFTDENVDYGLLHRDTPVYRFFLEYEKSAYAAADRLVAVDERIRRTVCSALDGQDIPVDVIRNAVDDGTFRPPEEPAYLDDNIILVPRRLVPKNGVLVAVLAAKVLMDRGVPFRMAIAGGGIERPAIESCIRENGLQDQVELLGAVPHDRVLSLYARAKIVAIPSVPSNNVEEATSLSALEGMACGKVVVASAIGGLREIIQQGHNGLLVDPGNPRALADALERALKLAAEAYLAIGFHARRDVERSYGAAEHGRRFLAVFEQSVEERIVHPEAER